MVSYLEQDCELCEDRTISSIFLVSNHGTQDNVHAFLQKQGFFPPVTYNFHSAIQH